MSCDDRDTEYLKKLTVLYVEDDLDTRSSMENILRPRVGTLVTAGNGREGVTVFHDQLPDIVITDILMPVMDGLAMSQEIRSTNRSVPIIVISAFERTDYLLRAIEIGVTKFVTKPVITGLLMAALLECAHRLYAEERLRHLALYDGLTDLPNRTLLKERLDMACAVADRNGEQVAMLFLDLDRFKEINDSYGHLAGDQVLRETAQRMKKLVRSCDTVCRLSGDEFLVVITGVLNREDIASAAIKMLDVLAQDIVIAGNHLKITPSIGISIYPENGTDMDALIRTSDSAMYHVKQQGGAGFGFY
jgi:diguanylate cyclase (GGDEF)-like protein